MTAMNASVPLENSAADAPAEVTLSDAAVQRIAAVLAGQDRAKMLRVAVSGGGCSGFQYVFSMEDTRADDDLVISRDGATVLIDSISIAHMQGAQIDFVDDLIGASFQIHNPQATNSCGCGTSFSL